MELFWLQLIRTYGCGHICKYYAQFGQKLPAYATKFTYAKKICMFIVAYANILHMHPFSRCIWGQILVPYVYFLVKYAGNLFKSPMWQLSVTYSDVSIICTCMKCFCTCVFRIYVRCGRFLIQNIYDSTNFLMFMEKRNVFVPPIWQ